MKRQKMADRFDIVYQAYLQTGKQTFYRDDHLQLFFPELKNVTSEEFEKNYAKYTLKNRRHKNERKFGSDYFQRKQVSPQV